MATKSRIQWQVVRFELRKAMHVKNAVQEPEILKGFFLCHVCMRFRLGCSLGTGTGPVWSETPACCCLVLNLVIVTNCTALELPKELPCTYLSFVYSDQAEVHQRARVCTSFMFLIDDLVFAGFGCQARAGTACTVMRCTSQAC